MKQLLDLFPIAAFAGCYYLTRDFYWATAVLMITTAAQAAFTWFTSGTLSKQHHFVLWSVLVLGALTLALHDKTFLFWKPTIVNWGFAVVLGAGVAAGRNPLAALFAGQLKLPDDVWRRIGYAWSVGFFIEGVLNLIVAFNFSEAFWVGYKLWGGIGITFLYVVFTGIYLYRAGHLDEPVSADAEANSTNS